MKTINKLISVMIVLALVLSLGIPAYAEIEVADGLRFLPVSITVVSGKAKVEGYFVNLSSNQKVSNIRDLDIGIYYDGEEIASGSFGDVDLSVSPLGMTYATLSFADGSHNGISHSELCDDFFTAAFNCSFSFSSSTRTGVASGYTYDSGNSNIGNRIRYLPTEIEVSKSAVVVKGYFVNMNVSQEVSNFEDFNMSVHLAGMELLDGSFGDVNVTIAPLSMQYHTFRYLRDYTDILDPGTYSCDDSCYCACSCNTLSAQDVQ